MSALCEGNNVLTILRLKSAFSVRFCVVTWHLRHVCIAILSFTHQSQGKHPFCSALLSGARERCSLSSGPAITLVNDSVNAFNTLPCRSDWPVDTLPRRLLLLGHPSSGQLQN